MGKTKSAGLRRSAGQVASGFAAVGLITAVCYPARFNFAVPAFLCLLAIVLLSLSGGFAGSVAISIFAVGCLDYFFIPPVLTWRISDPTSGVVLLTFCATSLVITRLSSKARNEARIAESKRRDVGLLYEVASRLLSLEPDLGAAPQSLRIFREVFGLNAVCLFDATAARVQVDGESAHGLAQLTRDSYIRGKDLRDSERKVHVRCVRIAGKLAGAIGFEGALDDDATAGSLSVLAATALERVRSFRSSSKAAAAAQAEMLRSAVLDAFAHEFKTPLAVILAAAGGLRETGGLALSQLEMVDIIENQTSRLSHLTTRLLRMARLDRDEVKPKMVATPIESLVTRLVEQYRNQTGDRPITVKLTQDARVMSDSELLNLALVQLLDNAVKYSPPGSPVTVEVDSSSGFAEVLVSNEGYSILPEEEDQIFERFYRGLESEHIAPGTGLGLYFARKIVRAHGGTLELDRDSRARAMTSFRIRLPLLEAIPQHELQAS
jgi:two-component system sensor histidine kinase KdpD